MTVWNTNVTFYILLYVATTFVNKYVLSVLQFTYPTIYQGWQTLVGTLLLRALIQTGQVHVDLTALSRTTVAPWIPAMMMYLVSIYSGSVALSKLPVPVFMSLHNVVYIFLATGEVIASGSNVTVRRYSLLMVILVSVVLISWTDPQYSPVGYFWMCIHIVSCVAYEYISDSSRMKLYLVPSLKKIRSRGLMSMYETLARYRIHLGDIDKMYLNYIYSLAVLIPCTYFLGDAMAAKHFQFWYYYRFYAGCVISGVCGVFLTVYRVKCKDLAVCNNTEKLVCIGKVLSSVLSLCCFPYIITADNSFWIIINLAAGVLLHQDDLLVPDLNVPHGFIEKEISMSEKNNTFHKEKVEKSDDEDEEIV